MQKHLIENAATARHVGYSVALARSEEDVREAQRLRYKVFADELGAQIRTATPSHDIDRFDAFCDHLIVRESYADRIVGTYRILSPQAARRAGGYYSDNEFFLSRLLNLRTRMVEVGRSCIHPDHRSGAVITLLWAGLADYMVSNKHEYLIGCASIGMGDGGHNAANLYAQIAPGAMAPAEYRVFPRHSLPVERLVTTQPALVPPLIKGYLRLGAWVCGEPAWDPYFNTADLLLLLPMARMNPRYMRHFIKPAQTLAA
ncbi:MAG: GNAT family N-acetyltransferase [Burkholderiaceae bacterium]|nr:GNAT family N-acetyltransferase [Sulfuritalea sp.]MCF8173700.1 GNAT family N-acetyltransferase [Burkholderiaceae bacterium]